MMSRFATNPFPGGGPAGAVLQPNTAGLHITGLGGGLRRPKTILALGQFERGQRAGEKKQASIRLPGCVGGQRLAPARAWSDWNGYGALSLADPAGDPRSEGPDHARDAPGNPRETGQGDRDARHGTLTTEPEPGNQTARQHEHAAAMNSPTLNSLRRCSEGFAGHRL